MGLDTYARQPFEQTEQSEKVLKQARKIREAHFGDVGNSLVGGMFSGHGSDGSFRGKVYDEDVERITGESLYQEEIDNETVKSMAEALEEAASDGDKVLVNDEDHLPALATWFRVAADNGYTVTGWW